MELDKDSFRFDKSNRTIYAIGDLHGDITPLIICLRDCCNVIKKIKGIKYTQQQIDNDMENELSKHWNDSSYKEDLNYEWIGGNSYVVICGDLINNSRNGGIKPFEYPFEEAKIFKFINAINEQAMKYCGKIFKIIGNHEFDSINGELLTNIHRDNMVTEMTKNYDGYKQNSIDRLHYFKKNNPGAELIAKDNVYLFVMIRDFIFTHGGISSDYFNVKNLNELNKKYNKYINNSEDTTFDYENRGNIEYALTNIQYIDDTHKIDNGLVKDRYFGQHDEEIPINDKCKKLENIFNNFYCDLKKYGYTENQNFKLVVGHSTQNNYVNPKYTINATFDNKIRDTIIDDIIVSNEFKSDSIYYGKEKKENNININNGISVSCPINGIPTIYRLDIGMSRGAYNMQNNNDDGYIYSRTPQILKIIYNENDKPIISIIKSSLENTRIHVPGLNIFNQK